jgi:hypothetical protein
LICPELIVSSTPQIAVIVTSSRLIGFERMSNDWKVEEVNYKFSEMLMPQWSKIQFSHVVPACQHRLTAAWLMFKNS